MLNQKKPVVIKRIIRKEGGKNMKSIEKLTNHIKEEIEDLALRNDISNYQQNQYLLGQTGRWVAWLGSGSQTAPTGT